MSQPASGSPVRFRQAIPILRALSAERDKAFYLNQLGFSLDFEHRFDHGFPLYAQISRAGLVLHLSEHTGDAEPGGAAFIWMTGVDALHEEFAGKVRPEAQLRVADETWGRVLQVVDPSGNRLRFCERAAS